MQALPRRPRRQGYRCAAALATQPPPPSFSGTDGDTVAAIVTPVVPQTGGVAIVRVSGDEAVSVVRRIFWPGPRARTRTAWTAESHRAVYGSVCEDDGSVIDEARHVAAGQELALALTHSRQVLVLPMLKPRSYTREDVVEVHCHGGSICVQRVLSLCLVWPHAPWAFL